MVQHALGASQEKCYGTPLFTRLIPPPPQKGFVGNHENLCKRTTNNIKKKMDAGPRVSFSWDFCLLNFGELAGQTCYLHQALKHFLGEKSFWSGGGVGDGEKVSGAESMGFRRGTLALTWV